MGIVTELRAGKKQTKKLVILIITKRERASEEKVNYETAVARRGKVCMCINR